MNNSSFTPPFPIDLNELDHNIIDHHHEDYSASSSSNNSISTYPFFISPSPQDFPYYHSNNLQHQDHHEVENLYASHGGSLTHKISSDDHHQINEKSGNNNKLFVSKKEDRENGSVKWMSSKMRLMRKMIIKSSSSTHDHDQTVANTSSDQNSNSIDQKSIQSSITSIEVDHNTTKNLLNNNNMNTSIRVCSDCNTTKTPLWRSGPRGPKSLCNACGIRQRKARRALAAAAQENGNGQAAKTTTNKVMKNKDQRTTNNNNNNNNHLPFKKRCKFTAQSRGGSRKNKLFNNFEDLSTLILSKNSKAFQQVFPQDEKEAAVLLMALSYGLVRG